MVMMNGTSTYGEPNRTYSFAERLGCDRKGWALNMRCLWNNWSIQLFVLLGLMFQIVLALLGSRRRISRAHTTRFIIWASHLLASYFGTLALSKLTTVSLNKSKEEYDTELKALLAPLVLLQLGNPDCITAYSVEDYRLSVRSGLNVVITFSFVVWILVRCWKTSIPMILFFPMFVAGTIKYGETIWALKSVYDENLSMKLGDFLQERYKPFRLRNSPTDILDILLMAHYRFECLKLLSVEWLKHPYLMLSHRHGIPNWSSENLVLITEMELGFIYDVLYTNAPVLYTKPGITLRFIGYFSLLLTLGGFMAIFFDQLLRDPDVIYAFGLLIGIVLLETYQFLKIFYSDWMLTMITKHEIRVPKFLKFLVKRSLKKERWSNKILQFDFLDYCLSDKQTWLFKILRLFGKAEKFMLNWSMKSVQIPKDVKTLLLDNIKMLETKRRHQPFTERGQWTLDAHESSHKLKWSINMRFDRSIIIWHIATHICYSSCQEKSELQVASKLISDYMMFLLVRRPHLLSLTTAKFTYRSAYSKFQMFLKEIPKEQRNRENILKILSGAEFGQEIPLGRSLEPEITRGWNVVEEARVLARELKVAADTWGLIIGVWAEMLCFAAYGCQQYHHVKMLRLGGEIITHVWLLLFHNTDESFIKKPIEIE